MMPNLYSLIVQTRDPIFSIIDLIKKEVISTLSWKYETECCEVSLIDWITLRSYRNSFSNIENGFSDEVDRKCQIMK